MWSSCLAAISGMFICFLAVAGFDLDQLPDDGLTMLLERERQLPRTEGPSSVPITPTSATTCRGDLRRRGRDSKFHVEHLRCSLLPLATYVNGLCTEDKNVRLAF